MSTAWAYLAVSSAKQEDTLADQEAWAQRVAAENGWEITRTFSGVSSGAHGIRKLLEGLLAELRGTPKSQRPARVLMIRVDRLGRGEGIEAVAALAEIRRLGVMIHTRQDGDVLIERASDAILPLLRSITGALENEARSEKSRAMHARKRSAGEVQGLPPYGFTIANAHLAVDDVEASYVRRLFELRAAGYSYGRLAQDARERAPGKRRKSGQRSPQRWAPTALISMLRNPVYRGSIVTDDLFDAVQARARNRSIARLGAKHPWPLNGALRCICGLRMTGRISGGTPRSPKTRYYLCPDPATHDGYPGHRAADLEEQFAALLVRLQNDPSLIAGYQSPDVDLDGLAARKAECERKLSDLDARRRAAWELAEEGGIDAHELRGRLADIAADRERLSASIERLAAEQIAGADRARSHADLLDALRIAASTWADANIEVRQQVAAAVSAVVGGLHADPARRHRLLVGSPHGAAGRKAETFCVATPSTFAREIRGATARSADLEAAR